MCVSLSVYQFFLGTDTIGGDWPKIWGGHPLGPGDGFSEKKFWRTAVIFFGKRRKTVISLFIVQLS